MRIACVLFVVFELFCSRLCVVLLLVLIVCLVFVVVDVVFAAGVLSVVVDVDVSSGCCLLICSCLLFLTRLLFVAVGCVSPVCCWLLLDVCLRSVVVCCCRYCVVSRLLAVCCC